MKLSEVIDKNEDLWLDLDFGIEFFVQYKLTEINTYVKYLIQSDLELLLLNKYIYVHKYKLMCIVKLFVKYLRQMYGLINL